MKKILTSLFIVSMLLLQSISFSQISFVQNPQSKISGASNVAYKPGQDLPVYFKMLPGHEVEYSSWQTWITTNLKLSPSMGFVYQSKETDQIGDVHYRYTQTCNGVPIFGNVLIVHTKNGRAYSFNGKIVRSIDIGTTTSMTENTALTYALASVNATTYKWQMPAEEALLKKITGNPLATYYPKGELYLVPDSMNFNSQNLILAYRFDVYADKPLSRAFIFVDAITGRIITKLNEICTVDAPGTAVTKYSGTQPLTTDSYNGSYRLRETGRGNGIETYNLTTGTNYGSAVDFTDADNNWNNVNAAQDEVATDAHWGAEMTYDFYKLKHNRNSIDNAGYHLLSYVHYDVNYDNAFWDGQKMTYGDGDGTTFTPFTALDVCGHEITHGLTTFTANLAEQNEPGALNEGYSDIFGTSIEWYARPSNANWTMGENIGTVLRNMSDPKSITDTYNNTPYPDTYLASGSWDANQEVHHNSTVVSYWYYLTSVGGSGTNDNGNAYNVTGISMDSANAVAFRTLTVYLISSSGYVDARFYSIQSAIDLFGACTPEVETVTNAWYACGVGAIYDPTVISDFSAGAQTYCIAPATAQFTNLSTNANVFHWDFGDGTTSTAMNPSHVYNTYGNFTVTLIASGGTCGTDTLVQTSYISVDTLNPCIVDMPQTGTGETQIACSGTLYDSGGNSNYQDNTNATITIAPIGAMDLTLHFDTFSFETNYDYLTIYDGPSTASPLIGAYTGNTLPNGGTITSTNGSVTLVQTSDMGVNQAGFVMHWHCAYPTAPPITNFKVDDTTSCTGIVNFIDLTTNGPVSWFWNFGDGTYSTLQQPSHTYLANGTYSVTLRTGNSFGLDSLTKSNYITINKPSDPFVVSASRCDSGSVTLSASGGDILQWYDAATGGNLVFSGTTFNTPILGATQTYYVQDSVPGITHNCGLPDISGTGGYTSSGAHSLIFNCLVPLKLVSVDIYGNTTTAPGSKTIELLSSAGTVLQSVTVNIASNLNTVPLNFDIPVGTGLMLQCTDGTNLFRNNAGLTYPYTTAGFISITGTDAGTGRYYYFYNWVISTQGCLSNRVPVTAGILLPNAQVTPNGNITLCSGQTVTFTSQAATSYLWTPGNETTQSIVVSTAGTYSVQITHDSCTAVSLPIVITTTSSMPVANFGYNNIDPLVNFSDSSLYGITYHWSFGDGGTSTLPNPSHTYLTNGTYYVTLIVTNPCGSDTITKPLDISSAGITNYENTINVAVYPNPSKGSFFLDIQSSMVNDISYRIFDIYGKAVINGTIRPTASETKLQISMPEAAKGVYMLRLWNGYINITKKLVID